jgi:hypothetical protein
VLSNRSLCWLRAGQAERALEDAKACRALRPDWAKACYREGAAHRLLQVCEIERCDWEFTHSLFASLDRLIYRSCVVILAEVWGRRKCLLRGRATWAREQRAGQRVQVYMQNWFCFVRLASRDMALVMAILRYVLFLQLLMFLMLMKQTTNREAIEAGRKFHGVDTPNTAQWDWRCTSWSYAVCLRLEMMRSQSSFMGRNVLLDWDLMRWWGTQSSNGQEIWKFAKFCELYVVAVCHVQVGTDLGMLYLIDCDGGWKNTWHLVI